jgi:DNA-directed RNA polymerase specialized sigma24 family protein
MSELTRANRAAADNGPLAPERGVPKKLARLLATLPPGRRRVAMALVADDRGRTYPQVAAKLGVSLGTVHQHLRRIRLRHREVWAAVIKERARQLRARHRRALARAKAHSKRWHEITKRRYLPTAGR